MLSRRDALRQLGVEEDATPADIERAFRSAIKDGHPDSAANGSGSRVDKLVQARDIALEMAPHSQALVPLSQAVELARIIGGGAPSVLERHTEKTVRQVVSLNAGKLAHLRRRLLSLGILSGGLTALVAILETATKFGVEYHKEAAQTATKVTLVIAALGVLTAVLSALAFSASSREKLLRLEIEDAAEALNDRATLVETLQEITERTGVALSAGWTRRILTDAVSQWSHANAVGPSNASVSFRGLVLGAWRRSGDVPLHATAYVIGPEDFTKLLTVKGLEREIVEESMVEDAGGHLVHGFRLLSTT